MASFPKQSAYGEGVYLHFLLVSSYIYVVTGNVAAGAGEGGTPPMLIT